MHAEATPAWRRYLGEWSGRNLRGFTGVVNIEAIGGRIIECHLRMADQWVDLNGDRLAGGRSCGLLRGWNLAPAGAPADTGYSVVLFGAPGVVPRIDP